MGAQMKFGFFYLGQTGGCRKRLKAINHMSKVKKGGAPHFELLYIVPNKYAEDELPRVTDKVKKEITERNGNITYSEDWGKLRLAYPIGPYHYGYYTLMEFDLSPDKVSGLARALKLSDEILRHQIVKKKIKTAKQIETEQKIARKIAAKTAKLESEAPAEKKEKEKKKVDLKELDEKLDKILEADDLL